MRGGVDLSHPALPQQLAQLVAAELARLARRGREGLFKTALIAVLVLPAAQVLRGVGPVWSVREEAAPGRGHHLLSHLRPM